MHHGFSQHFNVDIDEHLNTTVRGGLMQRYLLENRP